MRLGDVSTTIGLSVAIVVAGLFILAMGAGCESCEGGVGVLVGWGLLAGSGLASVWAWVEPARRRTLFGVAAGLVVAAFVVAYSIMVAT